MMLPSWFWRLVRSKRFKRLLIWVPTLMVVTLALGYLGVDWYGKKEWKKTVEKLSGDGYPSTVDEAIQRSAGEGLDVFEIQVVRNEIDRIRSGDDPLGDLSNLTLKGKNEDAFFDYESGSGGPDFTVFFNEEISNKLAAERIMKALVSYEDRRESLVSLRPDRWVLGGLSGEDDGFAFLNFTNAFLADHALVAIALGRSELVMEDLKALIAWSQAMDKTPQTAFGYMLGGMLRFHVSTIIEEGLMAGIFDEEQLGNLKQSLSLYDLQNGYRNAMKIEVSGWIEGYDEVMKNRPRVDWDSWRANWAIDRELFHRKVMSLILAYGPEGIHAHSLAEALTISAEEAAKTDDITFADFERFRRRNLARPTFPELELEEFALAPPLSESVWEFLEMAARSCLQGEARLRITREAVDLELSRLMGGGFPRVFEIDDPFSANSMGYRPENDGGYSIWSVGPDGVDEGGTGDDLVFRYWIRAR